MKKLLLVFCCISHFFAKAQFIILQPPRTTTFTSNEKYFSFSPFALLEPQIAIGAGFGNHFSTRSEYFVELSYLGKNPIYNYLVAFHGARVIFQYRYHLLKQWRPLINRGLLYRAKRKKIDPFIGSEFRLRGYNFTDEHTIVNPATNDTVNNYVYRANATIFAGAFIWGATYNVGKKGNWKIELTGGIGARIKMVSLRNMPAGYEMFKIFKTDLGAPEIFDATGLPYFPCAIRLRYIIH